MVMNTKSIFKTVVSKTSYYKVDTSVLNCPVIKCVFIYFQYICNIFLVVKYASEVLVLHQVTGNQTVADGVV